MKLWKAEVIDQDLKIPAGQVGEVGKDKLVIQTGKGCLSVTELQLEGKKRMNLQDFLRGYSIEKGTVLERRTEA